MEKPRLGARRGLPEGQGEGGVLCVERCPRSLVSNFSKTHSLEGLDHAFFPIKFTLKKPHWRQTEAGLLGRGGNMTTWLFLCIS